MGELFTTDRYVCGGQFVSIMSTNIVCVEK